MEYNYTENLRNITPFFSEISVFSFEQTIVYYALEQNDDLFKQIYSDNVIDKDMLSSLIELGAPTDITFIIETFEALLETKEVIENGIVFTPKMISDFISDSVIQDGDPSRKKVLDPGCGCGIFLVSAVQAIHKLTDMPFKEIINNQIYGIDIIEDNIRRCKLVLQLLVLKNGEKLDGFNFNLATADSLKTNWEDLFKVDGFDCIIGNPPYVNPHDLPKETSAFLRSNFKTTKKGTFNIFYAFIEKGLDFLKYNGQLSFIIPNNFMTISAAKDLRTYLTKNEYVASIIDFTDNMLFKPVRTYSCILSLSKRKKDSFLYKIIKNSSIEEIENELKKRDYLVQNYSGLDPAGWKLLDTQALNNIQKIESYIHSIGPMIRTGIATLKDEVYMVDGSDNGIFKNFDGECFEIEPTVVKTLYKVPELKKANTLEDVKRYIIFPYKHGRRGYEIIPEQELSDQYPMCYQYLCKRKDDLKTRSSGDSLSVWYEYGRSQGLNKYGKKLIFPTFANQPKFQLLEDVDALFCNGYAFFDEGRYPLTIYQKILNSSIMDYYVSKTSYPIEGGYYCYQKKYIANFTIPELSNDDLNFIQSHNGDELDNFLVDLYGIEL